MSITQVSSIPVSVDYTGRDYYSLREAMIARVQDRIPEWTASDPSDFGVALVEAFAYLGDVVAYYIDRTANESFLQTAVQRQSLLNIAQTYGYVPAGYRQATTDITFSNSSNADITIPVGTVVSGDVTSGDVVNALYFTTNAEIIIDAAVGDVPGTATVSASEGRSVTLVVDDATAYGELVGTSDGSPDIAFDLGEIPVVDGSIEVYVQDGDVYSKWTQVQHLVDYGPSDTVYSVALKEDDTVTINFGDGVSGVIPTAYSEVRAQYIVGGGSLGNVAANSITNIFYVAGLSESEVTALQGNVTLTNGTPGIGGSNPETDDQIRIAAPAAIRSGNRAVSLKDFSDIALSVSGVGKANATANVWTSVTVYIAPSRTALDLDPAPGLDDNEDPSAEYLSLKTEVETSLSDKVLIGTTVTVQPPSYLDVVVSLQYAILNQYSTTEVEANIKTALLTGFGYTGVNFGDTIYPQDIEFVVQQAPGVKTAKVTALAEIGDTGLNTLIGTPGVLYRFTEANLSLGEM
jgi:hypothetical protein